MNLVTTRHDVETDVVGAMRATQTLLDRGHDRILFVAGKRHVLQHRQREIGWTWAMNAAGIAPAEPLTSGGTTAGAYLVGLEISRDYDVSAVVVAGDVLAAALVKGLRDGGAQVPGQVVVVSAGEDLS